MLSEAAYTHYAQQYMDMVFRVAFGYVKSRADADDVVQAVFLRLWKRRPDFDGDAHARNWLLRVAVNESKRLLCAPWRRNAPLEGCEESALPSPAHRELLDAVLRLKPKYRTAIYLHYYEGMSTQEIADALGLPQNTVLTHLRRARDMNIREADPEEVFTGPVHPDKKVPVEWDGAKLVFSFDGPEECNEIHFKPTFMPYDVAQGLSLTDADGWYTRITCEGTKDCKSGQPCLIEVRYAPMFVDGGSLLLLYADDVSDIAEEEWNGYRILKFTGHRANPNFPDGSYDTCPCYYIMYQPEQGHVITVSSFEGNLETLEQIAKGLEIEQTDRVVSSADWHGHNEFMDCGVG